MTYPPCLFRLLPWENVNKSTALTDHNNYYVSNVISLIIHERNYAISSMLCFLPYWGKPEQAVHPSTKVATINQCCAQGPELELVMCKRAIEQHTRSNLMQWRRNHSSCSGFGCYTLNFYSWAQSPRCDITWEWKQVGTRYTQNVVRLYILGKKFCYVKVCAFEKSHCCPDAYENFKTRFARHDMASTLAICFLYHCYGSQTTEHVAHSTGNMSPAVHPSAKVAISNVVL